jgi:hypothetical protein
MDSKWVRFFYQLSPGDGAPEPLRGALLSCRFIENPEGAIVRSQIPDECWLLERAQDGVEPRVFVVDRAAWLAAGLSGGSPPAARVWLEVPREAPMRLRDPDRPGGAWLEGPMRELCRSCHPAADPFRAWREGLREP